MYKIYRCRCNRRSHRRWIPRPFSVSIHICVGYGSNARNVQKVIQRCIGPNPTRRCICNRRALAKMEKNDNLSDMRAGAARDNRSAPADRKKAQLRPSRCKKCPRDFLRAHECSHGARRCTEEDTTRERWSNTGQTTGHDSFSIRSWDLVAMPVFSSPSGGLFGMRYGSSLVSSRMQCGSTLPTPRRIR